MINERNEKMKTEMIGNCKNTMSTDNYLFIKYYINLTTCLLLLSSS